MTNKQLWHRIVILVLGLRAYTLIAAWIGIKFVPFKPSFPYWDAILVPYGDELFWSWANFDGVHYLTLAEKGYVYGLTQAFFPLYPILIRLVNLVVQNYLLSAYFISHVAFAGSLYFFYKLIRLDYSEKIARRALLFFVFFPTSFYFVSAYTESLFMLLVFSCFYFLRTRRFGYAGVCAFLLSSTRIVGVFMFPVFAMEIWRFLADQGEPVKFVIKGAGKRWTKLLSATLQIVAGYRYYLIALAPLLGLGAYMIYLWQQFGDPLMFAHVQEGFGGGRTTDKLVLLYQVIWRYIKIFFTVDIRNPQYFTIVLEFVSSISFIGIIAYQLFQKVHKSYLLFSILALVLPTLTGTFSSMPRYVLVAFPVFIFFAQLKNNWTRNALLLSFVLLLGLCTILFTRGYWLA